MDLYIRNLLFLKNYYYSYYLKFDSKNILMITLIQALKLSLKQKIQSFINHSHDKICFIQIIISLFIYIFIHSYVRNNLQNHEYYIQSIINKYCFIKEIVYIFKFNLYLYPIQISYNSICEMLMVKLVNLLNPNSPYFPKSLIIQYYLPKFHDFY